MGEWFSGRSALIGGVAAAVGASLCCIGPLVLLMLGIGGAWVANLTMLEPLRPYFLGLAVAFLLLAYIKLYRAPAAVCKPGSLCALPHTTKLYKALFWLVALLVVIAAASPYVAPLFY
jgi:mercuric ion transport protein